MSVGAFSVSAVEHQAGAPARRSRQRTHRPAACAQPVLPLLPPVLPLPPVDDDAEAPLSPVSLDEAAVVPLPSVALVAAEVPLSPGPEDDASPVLPLPLPLDVEGPPPVGRAPPSWHSPSCSATSEPTRWQQPSASQA